MSREAAFAFGAAAAVDRRIGRSVEQVAAVVEPGVGADRADDGARIGRDQVGLFDEWLQREPDHLPAALEESEGAGVAIDGRGAREVVIFRDVFRAVPAEKFFFDGLAIGMLADGAFAFVITEGIRSVGFRAVPIAVVPPGLVVESHVASPEA
jgi:hypothetical protein